MPPGNPFRPNTIKHFVQTNMQSFSDQELVSGVLQGSSVHQTALYRQFSVPMFRVLLRYAKDKSEAEDMLQDGFVRV